MTRTVVTVGAGQTAAVAARTLRRRGFDGAIVLVGDERHPPYQRPPLSKGFLQGDETAADLQLLSEQWCADQHVELRLGSPVVRLDPAARRVELADGSSVDADLVLFASGGTPRTLPGVAGERVVALRTLDDAQRIRDAVEAGGRIVTVGGGFIGAEIAASARMRGADVTVLEMLDVPLERVLGRRMGEVCAAIHRDRGVDLRTGETVASVTETPDGAVVHTAGGSTIEADLVVVGVGIVPNTAVAAAAGVHVDNGIVVDECCRTNVDGVFAAGDVANHYHPGLGRQVRVEHFDNASKQAAAAARAMLGQPVPYDAVHWFWSDQFDHNLQYAGHADIWDEVVIRGSVDSLEFTAFYLLGGVVQAAFAVDRGEDITMAKELIATHAAPGAAKLADEDVELEELVPPL